MDPWFKMPTPTSEQAAHLCQVPNLVLCGWLQLSNPPHQKFQHTDVTPGTTPAMEQGNKCSDLGNPPVGIQRSSSCFLAERYEKPQQALPSWMWQVIVHSGDRHATHLPCQAPGRFDEILSLIELLVVCRLKFYLVLDGNHVKLSRSMLFPF